MAILLSDLPISRVIMDSEKKHGINTHIVIECIPKENILELNNGEETEDSVYWWVELEDQKKIFETFVEVEKFLLEDGVSFGSEWFESMKEKQKIISN
jgi:hypothetical protein